MKDKAAQFYEEYIKNLDLGSVIQESLEEAEARKVFVTIWNKDKEPGTEIVLVRDNKELRTKGCLY